MNLYQTIYTSWVTECLRNFGHELPMNVIEPGSVSFLLSDEADPIQHRNGTPSRGFRMRYDLREVNYEGYVIN